MNWKTKASILRVCAALPGSGICYKTLQKTLGRLSDSPENHIPIILRMAGWLKDAGKPIAGATFFEVGTGHLPTVPVCFSLLGAAQFTTVDLYRRMDLDLLRGLLNRLASDRESFEKRLGGFAPGDLLRERLDLVQRHKDAPKDFMDAANITYLAPCDAGHTRLPDESIDIHLSVTVFEHIPSDTIAAILAEAHRILKDSGCAIHFIDPSDHFQHQDASISRTNFLRYSPSEWQRIAGNQFAYTNRLRRSDLVKLFRDAGFRIVRQEDTVDPEGIPPDFPLDSCFSGYEKDDLCTINVKLLTEKN